jgi:hypothetical protein
MPADEQKRRHMDLRIYWVCKEVVKSRRRKSAFPDTFVCFTLDQSNRTDDAIAAEHAVYGHETHPRELRRTDSLSNCRWRGFLFMLPKEREQVGVHHIVMRHEQAV